MDCSLVLGADGTGMFRQQAPGQPPVEASFRAMVNGDSFITALPGRLPSKDIAATDEPVLLLRKERGQSHFLTTSGRDKSL
ncbi:MAG TPA: hypothetical protein PKZ76_01200 [Xanthomonadaceae bacterium]|nr:hypothetical protein [Xanthomonadaceae bacterium]